MTGPLITAQGLGLKVEDRWLVQNLDLSLDRGSFLAVTGPSGSGKTTLLRTLAGEMEASLGSVKKQLDCHNRLAMIFQDLQLADGATALTNVLGGSLERHSFLSTFFGFPTHEQIEANSLLTQFGLSEKVHQWTSTLSRGERQRVAVCRTLLTRPLLLLADEPVSSLDPNLADKVLTKLKDYITSNEGSIVCALHNDDQVAKFADSVLHLDSSDPCGWKFEEIKKEEGT